jgi:hypothetical protein
MVAIEYDSRRRRLSGEDVETLDLVLDILQKSEVPQAPAGLVGNIFFSKIEPD